MTPTRDKKQWLAQYRKTSETLARIHAQEAYALTDERAREIIKSLCFVNTGEPLPIERPEDNGLVEQKRLFHRKKKT